MKTSNKNDNSKLAFKKNNSNDKVEFGGNNVEHAKKSRKFKS